MIEKFEEALQKNNCFWKCVFFFFLSWSRKSLDDVRLISAPIMWQGRSSRLRQKLN